MPHIPGSSNISKSGLGTDVPGGVEESPGCCQSSLELWRSLMAWSEKEQGSPPHHGPSSPFFASMDGFRVVKLSEVIRQVDVVITCTGRDRQGWSRLRSFIPNWGLKGAGNGGHFTAVCSSSSGNSWALPGAFLPDLLFDHSPGPEQRDIFSGYFGIL